MDCSAFMYKEDKTKSLLHHFTADALSSKRLNVLCINVGTLQHKRIKTFMKQKINLQKMLQGIVSCLGVYLDSLRGYSMLIRDWDPGILGPHEMVPCKFCSVPCCPVRMSRYRFPKVTTRCRYHQLNCKIIVKIIHAMTNPSLFIWKQRIPSTGCGSKHIGLTCIYMV